MESRASIIGAFWLLRSAYSAIPQVLSIFSTEACGTVLETYKTLKSCQVLPLGMERKFTVKTAANINKTAGTIFLNLFIFNIYFNNDIDSPIRKPSMAPIITCIGVCPFTSFMDLYSLR